MGLEDLRFDGVHELVKTFGTETSDGKTIVQFMDSNGITIADISVRLIKDDTTVHIDKFDVHPYFQGQGIGRNIVRRLREYGLGKGVNGILVSHPRCVESLGIYKKIGFEETEDGMYLGIN